jgi:hypothetical protein
VTIFPRVLSKNIRSKRVAKSSLPPSIHLTDGFCPTVPEKQGLLK